ncbi:MAG: 50S ribosomal protein L3 [Candidatus Coatesbacteria bacterium]|nr:50S ribosomal protein L3 [Candidatus Coatesbacteria bacterium]
MGSRTAGVIAQNIGMTQIFLESGEVIPVSVLQVGDCRVVQVKSKDGPDGYNAVQIGLDSRKKFKKTTKPLRGHLRRSGVDAVDFLREFRVDDVAAYDVGQKLDVGLFEAGDSVRITGTSKGRGFAGVVRRHGFSGGPKTHGSHFGRIPGSMGASATPSRVFKGRKLPGRKGGEQVTLSRAKIVKVVKERNTILVKGAVPGGVGGRYLLVSRVGDAERGKDQ